MTLAHPPAHQPPASPAPRPSSPLAEFVAGLILLIGFGFAALWGLSKLPFVGGVFGAVLAFASDWLSWGLSTAFSIATLLIKIALTVAAVVLAFSVRRKALGILLAAGFVAWLWTGWPGGARSVQTLSVETAGEPDVGEFDRRLDEVKRWDEVLQEWYRQRR